MKLCKILSVKRSAKSRRASRLVRRSRLLFALAIIGGVIAALLLLPGCANTPAIVQALAQDTNSVSVKVTTPWGGLDYQRN